MTVAERRRRKRRGRPAAHILARRCCPVPPPELCPPLDRRAEGGRASGEARSAGQRAGEAAQGAPPSAVVEGSAAGGVA